MPVKKICALLSLFVLLPTFSAQADELKEQLCANAYSSEKSPEVVYEVCHDAAEEGSVIAKGVIGSMQARGVGTEQDLEAGLSNLEIAALAGYPSAQFDVAHYTGKHAREPKDWNKVFHFWTLFKRQNEKLDDKQIDKIQRFYLQQMFAFMGKQKNDEAVKALHVIGVMGYAPVQYQMGSSLFRMRNKPSDVNGNFTAQAYAFLKVFVENNDRIMVSDDLVNEAKSMLAELSEDEVEESQKAYQSLKMQVEKMQNLFETIEGAYSFKRMS